MARIVESWANAPSIGRTGTLKKLADTTHERLSRDVEVVASSERSFGIVMSVVFSIIAVWPAFYSNPLRWWSLLVAVLLVTLAWAKPNLLRPLNVLWLRFGLFLNKVLSPVFMGLAFFGVFTPYGLVMRLAGRDALHLQFDPDAQTYWITRSPPGPAPESIKNQY